MESEVESAALRSAVGVPRRSVGQVSGAGVEPATQHDWLSLTLTLRLYPPSLQDPPEHEVQDRGRHLLSVHDDRVRLLAGSWTTRASMVSLSRLLTAVLNFLVSQYPTTSSRVISWVWAGCLSVASYRTIGT